MRELILPRHDDLSLWWRIFEGLCILVAAGLSIAQVVRINFFVSWTEWWLLVVILTGIAAADFVSGIVHWIADTWGSETMPVLGRRFLYPFRVHHVNPDDLLRREFLDTNGDVAMMAAAFPLAGFWIPLEAVWGQALDVFLVSFTLAGLPTNQVHKWAHMPSPPRWLRWLQQSGIILSREAHHRHHEAPYAMNYCIATG